MALADTSFSYIHIYYLHKKLDFPAACLVMLLNIKPPFLKKDSFKPRKNVYNPIYYEILKEDSISRQGKLRPHFLLIETTEENIFQPALLPS